jgi:FkbM family methyltransferase
MDSSLIRQRVSRVRPWLGRAARRAIRFADHPWGRPMIAWLMQRLILRIHGERARVRYDVPHACWVIDWPQASVPVPEPWHGPTPQDVDAQARDVFFQEYTPTEGDVVFDVGAGIGSELNLFSRLVGPTGHVYAIEADPETFRLLRLRRELNGLENVTLINAALVDQPGEVLISNQGPHEGHHLIDAGNGHKVRAETLDDEVAEHGIGRIDLLKMNIEGAERRALTGMATSAGLVGHAVISCHDYLATSRGQPATPTKEFVRDYLVSHGFDVVGRRDDDDRDWARDYLYGRRAAQM